ncbi:MAG: 30S ribosomal protein S1 [Bacteroidetes bacterium]|nr:30S ribosomal protein S1 [Bacteroidota bacterium]
MIKTEKSSKLRYNSKLLEKQGNKYTKAEREKLEKLYEEKITPTTEEYTLIKGKIINIRENGAVLDIGLKSDGVLPISELRGLPDLKVGDEIEVYLEAKEDKSGNPIISRKKANLVKAWELIQEALENKTVLQGLVKRRTKGGLIVDINGIEAFLPGSQIDVSPILDFDKFIGNTIDVAVIKIKHANDNVVVSHKVLIEKEIESQKISIINNLEKGQILEGTVKNVTNFGVFIDLGGVDGLLHITDISWSKVTNPESMFQRGQKVKVVVTDFDEAKKRISLGMKQLTPHPWDSLPEDIKEGSIVKGKIVNLTDYGAFLEIQKGVEGLVHVSEMSWSQYINSPKDYVKLGDQLEAKVLSIDRENKKMSLGLKQLTSMPWSNEIAGKKYPVGTKHKGIVRNITNFGAFIELEPGLEGLLHISDMSWTKKINHPSELLKVGDEIEIQVLTLDIDNKKLTLGIKQLEEDPWDTFEEVFKEGSTHKGTIIKKMSRGATVELPYGIEGYVPKKSLIKENKKEAEVGDVLDFVVLEFVKDEHRIVLSHTDTFEKKPKKKPANFNKKNQPSRNLVTATKSTLGDIEELSMLKEQISKKNNKTVSNESQKQTNEEKSSVKEETQKNASKNKADEKEEKKMEQKNESKIDNINKTEEKKEVDKKVEENKEAKNKTVDKKVEDKKEAEKNTEDKKEAEKNIEDKKEADKNIEDKKETDKNIEDKKEADKNIEDKKAKEEEEIVKKK